MPLAGLTDGHFNTVASLLRAWGLLEAPCLVSEDGTALQMRIDVLLRKNKILVFGLSGCSFEMMTLDDLKAAATKRRLASTLYAYTLVPLVRGAPHFPLFAWCHDNSAATFGTKIAMDIWQYIWQV